MVKTRQQFVCQECGAAHSKWLGQCNECYTWNTLKEVTIASVKAKLPALVGYAGDAARVEHLADIKSGAGMMRTKTGLHELDRVLGGGLMAGSVVLLGGDPGAGKSTLLLQVAAQVCERAPVLYITGEESLEQVAMRANRLGLADRPMRLASETSVEHIVTLVAELKPKMLIVDSIQTLFTETVSSAPGTVSQVRESSAILTRLAKQTNTTIMLIGHITKEGELAGPKVLEHMIDCFLLLETGLDQRFRNLRSLKNRFGAVGELGIFAMLENGLKGVSNPSAIFLRRGEEELTGSIATVLWEGTQPLLVEIQALVDDCQGAYPKRVTAGFDNNRLALQLAVLHKQTGISMVSCDVFVNIAGGIRISETAADLAAQIAILSSHKAQSLSVKLLAFGEVGLSGEVRPVSHSQERLKAASKHGFNKVLLPWDNRPKGKTAPTSMELLPVRHLSEALDIVFSA